MSKCCVKKPKCPKGIALPNECCTNTTVLLTTSRNASGSHTSIIVEEEPCDLDYTGKKNKSKIPVKNQKPSRQKVSINKKKRESDTSVKKSKSGSSTMSKHSKYSLKNDPTRYKPILYTFRMPLMSNNQELKNARAKCPPFYLHLDHALAVIWSLISKDQLDKPLGIVQLQWALIFLQGIVSKKTGENPPDVSLCVQAIQDQLIERYAEMVDNVVGFDACNVKKKPSKSSEISLQAFVSSNGSIRNKNVRSGASKVVVTRTAPFSINYLDINKSQNEDWPQGVEQIFKANPYITEEQMKTVVDKIKERTEDECLEQTGSENMVEFLKSWRKEQIDKIQAELKRLRSIEEFMENVDKVEKNANPFLNDLESSSMDVDKFIPEAIKQSCPKKKFQCVCKSTKKEKKAKEEKETKREKQCRICKELSN